jgi:hypothetical protein
MPERGARMARPDATHLTPKEPQLQYGRPRRCLGLYGRDRRPKGRYPDAHFS